MRVTPAVTKTPVDGPSTTAPPHTFVRDDCSATQLNAPVAPSAHTPLPEQRSRPTGLQVCPSARSGGSLRLTVVGVPRWPAASIGVSTSRFTWSSKP